LLNLAFEAAQRTFKSFAILQMDFCQLEIHHLPNVFSVARRENLAVAEGNARNPLPHGRGSVCVHGYQAACGCRAAANLRFSSA
jgi:hypothetical protein